MKGAPAAQFPFTSDCFSVPTYPILALECEGLHRPGPPTFSASSLGMCPTAATWGDNTQSLCSSPSYCPTGPKGPSLEGSFPHIHLPRSCLPFRASWPSSWGLAGGLPCGFAGGLSYSWSAQLMDRSPSRNRTLSETSFLPLSGTNHLFPRETTILTSNSTDWFVHFVHSLNGIIQYMLFWVWLLYLNILFLQYIHVVACNCRLFTLVAV